MKLELNFAQIKRLEPCEGSLTSAKQKLKNHLPDRKEPYNVADAKNADIFLEDILWVLGEFGARRGRKEVARCLRLFSCDCAARALIKLGPDKTSHYNAYIRAIATARSYARGTCSLTDLRAVNVENLPGPSYVGYELRMAIFCTSAPEVSLITCADTAGYALSVISGVVRVGPQRRQVRVDEEEWQYSRLVQWFSENEPEDIPLPEVKEEIKTQESIVTS